MKAVKLLLFEVSECNGHILSPISALRGSFSQHDRNIHQRMIDVHIFRAAKCCSYASYDTCIFDGPFTVSPVSEKMSKGKMGKVLLHKLACCLGFEVLSSLIYTAFLI